MGEPITCVSFTEDEQCVLASCLDSTIKLIDKETGCVLNTYKSHTNKDFKIENSVAIKDTSIISGSEDGTLFIWDLITAEVTFERKKAHNSVLYGLSRHPSKNIFVTASTDSVKLWKDNGEKDDEEWFCKKKKKKESHRKLLKFNVSFLTKEITILGEW